LVAVHVKSGMLFSGNAVTPAWAVHPVEQFAVRLCPTVNTPPLDT
jgi:hypothetical protein